MATNSTPRIRRSIRELEKMYKDGNTAPLEKLMLAWDGIKRLPPDNENSMFNIGGFHGEPFRGPGQKDGDYWGGYCNHANALFPAWHRAYLYRIENALRSIPGCEDVTIPYWDETDEESVKGGIPFSFTDEKIIIKGKEMANPLRSYRYQKRINDDVSGDDNVYTKPEGVYTIRYPYSGLYGTPEAREKSREHNKKIGYPDSVLKLNNNVVGWLNATITLPAIANRLKLGGVARLFELCLDAPNYTVFSNTTSAAYYNTSNPLLPVVVPLESPHNDLHLAIGGFDVPSLSPNSYSPYPGANGDMGENDTAAFDPIFYFHHANIDRMFWVWQKKNNAKDQLEIKQGYPGTFSSDKDNPPAYPYDKNVQLTVKSELDPFINPNTNKAFIFEETVNIEKQLGYTYTIGSLDKQNWETEELAAQESLSTKKLHVSNINRGNIFGSFVIRAFATVEGKEYYIGHHSVLSRWNVLGCANCRAHINAEAHFNLGELANILKLEDYRIVVTGREEFQEQLAETLATTPIQIDII